MYGDRVTIPRNLEETILGFFLIFFIIICFCVFERREEEGGGVILLPLQQYNIYYYRRGEIKKGQSLYAWHTANNQSTQTSNLV